MDAKALRGEVPFFRVNMDDDLNEDCVRRDDHIALVEAKDAEIAHLTAELTALRAGHDAMLRAERNKVLRDVAKLYENGGGPGLGGWDYFGDFYDAILAMIEPEGK